MCPKSMRGMKNREEKRHKEQRLIESVTWTMSWRKQIRAIIWSGRPKSNSCLFDVKYKRLVLKFQRGREQGVRSGVARYFEGAMTSSDNLIRAMD